MSHQCEEHKFSANFVKILILETYPSCVTFRKVLQFLNSGTICVESDRSFISEYNFHKATDHKIVATKTSTD